IRVLFEARSLPAISRCYPRSFAFYTAYPRRSIRNLKFVLRNFPEASSLGNPMLFLETRFEALQIDRLPRLSAFRTGPEILDRPRDRLLELTSRAQGPIRIAQKL